MAACKGVSQKAEAINPVNKFDFSKVDNFKETKTKGQIVNDYSNVFDSVQRQELSDIIYDYDIKTTRQIVVVTIDSISPYSDIQKFSTDLGNYWGVGTAEKDNGLIMVLCKPCKKIGIATGTGTEKILTNEICKEVIDKTIIPEFKKGNFYAGVKNGVEELILHWK